MKPENQPAQVKLITFKDTKVAVLEHRGDPNLIGESIRKFIEWRKQNRLSPKVSATFNILYDNPASTSPDDYRLDICASTQRDLTENSFGVVERNILVVDALYYDTSVPTTISVRALRYLYSEWLPLSKEEPRDFPLYFQRVSFFPDVPEHEAVTDVFLPLQ